MEYDELKRFLVTVARFRDERYAAPVSILTSLQGVLAAAEGRGSRVPVGALRQAAHDQVSWFRSMPRESIREADAYLRDRGAITITVMMAEVGRMVLKVLKRGRIRDDEEFYVLTELLNDVSSGLVGRDRERAGKLVSDYESRSGPKTPARRLTTG